jgi:hypothetical protein
MIDAVWPKVRRGIVRALRSNLELSRLLVGDWSEGIAPIGTQLPYGIYSLAAAPTIYDWTGRIVEVLADVVVFARSKGDAASINQLVLATLQDAKLQVPELTVLSVRHTGIISMADVDAEGKIVYEEGGSYFIRVAQSAQTANSMTLSLNLVIQ